jgi:hypothetical protein
VTAEAQPAADRPPALRWDAQHQFVGALLGHRAATAARLLAVVPDDAITDPLTRWTLVMYARTLFWSPNNVTLGGWHRRWTASVANPRLHTLDSQGHLSAAERRRMICDVDRQVPDCGFDTFPLGRCVDGDEDATRDLARMNLHRAVNWEALR